MAAVTACGGASPSPGPEGASPAAAIQPAVLPTAPPPGPQTLSETGSTLLYPLFSAWAPAYKRQFPNVTINIAPTGSTTGISAAASGKADIGASDAYLSSAKLARYPALENIPLEVSAQMINYNLPGVTGNLMLDSTVLAGMYQGQITRWNDQAIRALNPGVPLPPLKIIPLHRVEGSGDTFLFTSYLSKPGSSWANSISFSNSVAWPPVTGALGEQGNMGMVTGCEQHPGCVAYIGISYRKQTAGKLGEARLLNSSGNYVLPDKDSISAAADAFAGITPASGAISLIDSSSSAAYPIVNYEYAIVSTRQPSASKAATIRALLNWILTDGSSPAYLASVNFEKLPPQVAIIADALIARIG